MKTRQYLCAVLLVVLLAGLFFLIPTVGTPVGQGEFRAYWSASYLLAHRENMYDGDQILRVQTTYTGFTGDKPFLTLSPPWTVLILIPFTFLSFARAAWIWLSINTLLLGASAILLWQIASIQNAVRKHIWIPLLAAYAFSMNLTAIANGQTTVFVLAMIAVFLTCEQKRYDLLAGITIAATLVKPQIVFVTLVVIALYVLRTRRWQMAIGFGGTVVLTALVLWAIRPSWLQDYLASAATANLLGWESSNLGGILFLMTGWIGVRFLSLIAVPLVVLACMRWGTKQNFRIFIDASLLLSLITAPYGFSYDQTTLLVPILTLLALGVRGVFQTWDRIAIAGALVTANVLSYYQRVTTSNDVYFFWLPLFIGVIYVYCIARTSQTVSEYVRRATRRWIPLAQASNTSLRKAR